MLTSAAIGAAALLLALAAALRLHLLARLGASWQHFFLRPPNPGLWLDAELAAVSLRLPVLLVSTAIFLGDAVLTRGPGAAWLSPEVKLAAWLVRRRPGCC